MPKYLQIYENEMLNSFKKVIDDLEFEAVKEFKDTPLEKTAVVFGHYRGSNVVLKLVGLANRAKTETFMKELEVDQILRKHGGNLKIVHILDSGHNSEAAWIIREYYEGQTLEDLLKNDCSQETDILDSAIGERGKLFKVKDDEIKKYCVRFELDLNKNDQIENLLQLNLNKCREFFASVKLNYLKDHNTGTVSGDFKPSNIFVTPKRKVILSDFEWLSYDNFSIDFAFLWLYLYEYPNQQNFILTKLKSDQDKDFFRASVIRIVMSWYNGANAYSKDPLAKKKRLVWIKYLLAAGESYEELISTK